MLSGVPNFFRNTSYSMFLLFGIGSVSDTKARVALSQKLLSSPFTTIAVFALEYHDFILDTHDFILDTVVAEVERLLLLPLVSTGS